MPPPWPVVATLSTSETHCTMSWSHSQAMPPPSPSAVFDETSELSTLTVPRANSPPPSPPDVLPLMEEPVMATPPCAAMPPPSAPAVLPVISAYDSVSSPVDRIPPPKLPPPATAELELIRELSMLSSDSDELIAPPPAGREPSVAPFWKLTPTMVAAPVPVRMRIRSTSPPSSVGRGPAEPWMVSTRLAGTSTDSGAPTPIVWPKVFEANVIVASCPAASWAPASAVAARRVHAPSSSAQSPLPGELSGESARESTTQRPCASGGVAATGVEATSTALIASTTTTAALSAARNRPLICVPPSGDWQRTAPG